MNLILGCVIGAVGTYLVLKNQGKLNASFCPENCDCCETGSCCSCCNCKKTK